MKKTIPFLTILFTVISMFTVTAQDPWIKVIGSNYIWVRPISIRETYDKAYLVHHVLTPTATVNNKVTRLMKTDVNGNTLWEISIKSITENVLIYGIDETPDGGFILYGEGGIYSIDTPSPFIMKLNACMEKEWCKIDTTNETTMAMDAIALPDGSYVIYKMDYNGFNNCLIKLNAYGQTIWKKLYTANNPDYDASTMLLQYVEADSTLVLSGSVNMNLPPDSMGQARPFISKISMDGDVLWEFYEIPDPEYNNVITRLITGITPSGNFILPIYRNSDSTEFIRVNSAGEFISVSTLLPPPIDLHVINSIEAFGDDKILHGIQTFNNEGDPVNASLVQTDVNGNLINKAIIDDDFTEIVVDIAVTSNNKVLSVNTYEPKGFTLMKFDENMTFSGQDNGSYNYDSKCDHQIVSSEIVVDCLTYGYDKSKLNLSLILSPNPSSEYLKIQLPDIITTTENRGPFTVTTSKSNYLRNLIIQVYDINGMEIYHSNWPDNTLAQIISLSGYRNGMYMVKVSGDNGIVVTGKIVVSK